MTGDHEQQETYNCGAYCLNHDGTTANLKQRKAWRCALPDFPRRHWDDPGERPTRYMGRLPILPEDGEHPFEPYEDGCPGAWYRCNFVLSLHKYERFLTQNGFSDNLITSRQTDRLVLEALSYYEAEKLRAHARDNEVRWSK